MDNGDVCGDNRFKIIEAAKERLLRCTNIETSPEEMKCLDSFLFRCWQMRWIDEKILGDENPKQVNNTTCRKALESISNLADAILGESEKCDANIVAILDECRDALSSKPRNCDVLTEEGLSEKFDMLCDRHLLCNNCPLSESGGKKKCTFKWSQMDYEDGCKILT